MAIEKGGYFYDGSWYPHVYSHPFLYYSYGYSTFIAGGGRPIMTNTARYSAMPASPTTRGGFGSSGAARVSAAPHMSFGG